MSLSHLATLWWGTVIYRPYVYAFFVCFLCFALPHLRLRGTAIYLLLSYAIAYVCEYSATRNGFPFGRYVYLDDTRTRELWLSNIPFWDSLSFVFLSYFSWQLATALRAAFSGQDATEVSLQPKTALLGGFLMMLLDVVIDPLTLLGDQWFLGKIYYYPNGGSYFGVTLSNFAGWFFVGAVTLAAFAGLARAGIVDKRRWVALRGLQVWALLGVYTGVLGFQLAVTAWIGAWTLLGASSAVSLFTVGACLLVLARRPAMINA